MLSDNAWPEVVIALDGQPPTHLDTIAAKGEDMVRTLVATPDPEPYTRIAHALHRRQVTLATTTAATLRAPLRQAAHVLGRRW